MKRFEHPIIFLDIDGVIANMNDCCGYFSPECVERLNRIIVETGAKVIVSSAWRKITDRFGMRDILRDGFFRGDVDIEPQGNDIIADAFITVTPGSSDGYRGGEIDELVKWYKLKNFIILDDSSDMEPYMDRLIRTDPYEGLSDKDADLAIKMLKGD